MLRFCFCRRRLWTYIAHQSASYVSLPSLARTTALNVLDDDGGRAERPISAGTSSEFTADSRLGPAPPALPPLPNLIFPELSSFVLSFCRPPHPTTSRLLWCYVDVRVPCPTSHARDSHLSLVYFPIVSNSSRKDLQSLCGLGLIIRVLCVPLVPQFSASAQRIAPSECNPSSHAPLGCSSGTSISSRSPPSSSTSPPLHLPLPRQLPPPTPQTRTGVLSSQFGRY